MSIEVGSTLIITKVDNEYYDQMKIGIGMDHFDYARWLKFMSSASRR